MYPGLEVEVVIELHKDKDFSPDLTFEFLGRVPSLSENVSQSGMVCRTSRKIEEMTIVDIRFELPKLPDKWVECSGIVVNCEKKGADTATLPYEVAIFFDRISERDRTLLASFVKSKRNAQQPV